MKHFFIVLLLSFSQLSVAQSNLKWTKTFSNNQPATVYHSKIFFQHDTLVNVGRKKVNNNDFLTFLYHDVDGNLLQEKTIGDSLSFANQLTDYKIKGDTIYLLRTTTNKAIIQKYSLSGQIYSSFNYGLTDTLFYPYSIHITSNGTLFLTAGKNYPTEDSDDSMGSNFNFVYAFSSSGNLLWERDINVSPLGRTYLSATLLVDDTLYVGGDMFCKLSVDNNIINLRPNYPYFVYRMQETDDGNLVSTLGQHYQVSKLTKNGTVLWNTTYPDNLFDSTLWHDDQSFIESLVQDDDGNTYVTGSFQLDTGSVTEPFKVLTLKIDKNGVTRWANFYNYPAITVGNTLTLKNNFVYVGGTAQIAKNNFNDYKYLLLKIDTQTGVLKGDYTYEPDNGGYLNEIYSVAVDDNQNVAWSGLQYSDGMYDWIVQYLSDLTLKINELKEFTFKTYPNPAHDEVFIFNREQSVVELVTLEGKSISISLIQNQNSTSFKVNELPKGIYLIKCSNQIQKLLIE